MRRARAEDERGPFRPSPTDTPLALPLALFAFSPLRIDSTTGTLDSDSDLPLSLSFSILSPFLFFLNPSPPLPPSLPPSFPPHSSWLSLLPHPRTSRHPPAPASKHTNNNNKKKKIYCQPNNLPPHNSTNEPSHRLLTHRCHAVVILSSGLCLCQTNHSLTTPSRFVSKLGAGAVAGIVGVLIVYPLDMVKTRSVAYLFFFFFFLYSDLNGSKQRRPLRKLTPFFCLPLVYCRLQNQKKDSFGKLQYKGG